jgi:hypothetical protein
VLCKAELSASGRSLIQRIPIECDVPVCDFETSTMRRLGPSRVVAPQVKQNIIKGLYLLGKSVKELIGFKWLRIEQVLTVDHNHFFKKR